MHHEGEKRGLSKQKFILINLQVISRNEFPTYVTTTKTIQGAKKWEREREKRPGVRERFQFCECQREKEIEVYKSTEKKIKLLCFIYTFYVKKKNFLINISVIFIFNLWIIIIFYSNHIVDCTFSIWVLLLAFHFVAQFFFCILYFIFFRFSFFFFFFSSHYFVLTYTSFGIKNKTLKYTQNKDTKKKVSFCHKLEKKRTRNDV